MPLPNYNWDSRIRSDIDVPVGQPNPQIQPKNLYPGYGFSQNPRESAYNPQALGLDENQQMSPEMAFGLIAQHGFPEQATYSGFSNPDGFRGKNAFNFLMKAMMKQAMKRDYPDYDYESNTPKNRWAKAQWDMSKGSPPPESK
tara:strand:+ start:975 stop:1403 length:429 start_codon:yes stop_codon:yes gene_type:complete